MKKKTARKVTSRARVSRPVKEKEGLIPLLQLVVVVLVLLLTAVLFYEKHSMNKIDSKSMNTDTTEKTITF